MIELVAPPWTESAKPTPRADTNKRFADGTIDRNLKVDDDINWKMTLSKWAVKCNKWRKDEEAWTENSARVYNLVLTHCPPELEAEMQNHSTWAANTTKQDCIVLLVMIHALTHNMKETKQGTMALVECHADLYTTVQGPNESIEDFLKSSWLENTRSTRTAEKQDGTSTCTSKPARN